MSKLVFDMSDISMKTAQSNIELFVIGMDYVKHFLTKNIQVIYEKAPSELNLCLR